MVLAFPVLMFAQSVTPNAGFQIPATGSNNWYIPLNYNFTLIDQYLSGQRALPAINVSGPANLPGLVIPAQTIINALGFTPAFAAGTAGQAQFAGASGAFSAVPHTFYAISSTQTCINNGASTGKCILPPGYTETLSTPIVISNLNNFTLECGPGATLITNGVNAINVINGSNISIIGCTFNGQNLLSGNGINVSGTNNITLVGNTIKNWNSQGVYVYNGSGLDAELNQTSGNVSDDIYGENWNGAKVLKNTLVSTSATFHHAIAFHGSFAGDAASITSTCTINTVNIASIVGASGTVTVTTSTPLPSNIVTGNPANIAGTVNFNGFYNVTVVDTTHFTFPLAVTASETTGTVNAGSVTALHIGNGGHNFATTGNFQFINGQETAGGISSDVTSATWTTTAGVITGSSITNPGFCMSNPAVHAANNDLVQNIEVGSNIISIGSAFCTEIGSFGGMAGNGANIHDNQCTKTDTSTGYGGYSIDTMNAPMVKGNYFVASTTVPPNLAGIEIVNSQDDNVTDNNLVAAAISQNGSGNGVVAHNTLKSLTAGAIGIYNGSSDYNKPSNSKNIIAQNKISWLTGVIPAAGIETQANGLAIDVSNANIVGNTINVSSGLASGNAIVYSCTGLNINCSHINASSNIIGPWRHAYSISTLATGSLNLNDDTQSADTTGAIGTPVTYFPSSTNQVNVKTITFDGSSASAMTNLQTLSLVSQSVGGVFNMIPSSGFAGELVQATLDNLILQAGNSSNPRTIWLCGNSDVVTTNCPAFFNDAETLPNGNYNAPANGTNGFCFSGTGNCFTWNTTLGAIHTKLLESDTNIYLNQPSSGFWNRFTQLGTLTGNQSINIPNGNSATVPSLSAIAGTCVTGFSSTSATLTTGVCLGVGQISTTTTTVENVTVTGATTASHCSLTPTNAAAATNYITSFISAKAANTITVTHAAIAGMNYDLTCSVN